MVHSSSVIASSCCVKVTLVEILHNTEHCYNNNNNSNPPILSNLPHFLYTRVVLFMPEEHCFMTFESDHLTIPFTTNYKIYYTPMTNEGMQLITLL